MHSLLRKHHTQIVARGVFSSGLHYVIPAVYKMILFISLFIYSEKKRICFCAVIRVSRGPFATFRDRNKPLDS